MRRWISTFLLIVGAFVFIKITIEIVGTFGPEIADAALLFVILFALSLYAWPKETKAAAKRYIKDLTDIFGDNSKCEKPTGECKKK
jgi:hypothetical protein